jgi:hypothetical protein
VAHAPQPGPPVPSSSTRTACGAQPIQVSPCAGMTLYQVQRELQLVLAVILGTCPLCTQPLEPVHKGVRALVTAVTVSMWLLTAEVQDA